MRHLQEKTIIAKLQDEINAADDAIAGKLEFLRKQGITAPMMEAVKCAIRISYYKGMTTECLHHSMFNRVDDE